MINKNNSVFQTHGYSVWFQNFKRLLSYPQKDVHSDARLPNLLIHTFWIATFGLPFFRRYITQTKLQYRNFLPGIMFTTLEIYGRPNRFPVSDSYKQFQSIYIDPLWRADVRRPCRFFLPVHSSILTVYYVVFYPPDRFHGGSIKEIEIAFVFTLEDTIDK